MTPFHTPKARSSAPAAGRRIVKRNGRIIVGAPPRSGPGWFESSALAAYRCLAIGMRSRVLSGSIAAMPLMVCATVARGQVVTPLVTPIIAPDYSRGRNISVIEVRDPNYQELGIRSGSVIAFPSIGLTAGATDNVYTNNDFKRSDAYVFLQPRLRVTTDLPIHEFNIVANGDIQRYVHEQLRNQNAFFLYADGRLDIGRDFSITGRMQYTRAAESPYASDLSADVSVLSQYTRASPAITAIYKVGRVRLTAKAEHTDFKFSSIAFADGTQRDQRERNRTLDRFSLQGEYGLSPSLATFVQINYDKIVYPNPRADGGANRSSTTPSILGGLNFDLAGFMRGSIAAGYINRNYRSPTYNNEGGLTLQAQAEFFPSALTTVGFGAQRTIQDSSSAANGAYSDTRASVNVDHALLRNLILSAQATTVRQKLLDTNATSRLILTSFTARYQSNRFVSLEGNVQYAKGTPGEIPLGVAFNELRGQVTVRFRR